MRRRHLRRGTSSATCRPRNACSFSKRSTRWDKWCSSGSYHSPPPLSMTTTMKMTIVLVAVIKILRTIPIRTTTWLVCKCYFYDVFFSIHVLSGVGGRRGEARECLFIFFQDNCRVRLNRIFIFYTFASHRDQKKLCASPMVGLTATGPNMRPTNAAMPTW